MAKTKNSLGMREERCKGIFLEDKKWVISDSVTIKAGYLDLTGDAIEAALLEQMIYYHRVSDLVREDIAKYGNSIHPIDSSDGWVAKSTSNILKDLPVLGSEKTTLRKIGGLVFKKLLFKRTNTRLGFDRTNEYRVNFDKIKQHTDQDHKKCLICNEPIPETGEAFSHQIGNKCLLYNVCESCLSQESFGKIVLTAKNILLQYLKSLEIASSSAYYTPRQNIKIKREGYVYLIEGYGKYKIGVAKNVEKRLKTIGSNLPFALNLIYSKFLPNSFGTERNLHEMFGEKRIAGEWFMLSSDDIEAVKNACEEACQCV